MHVHSGVNSLHVIPGYVHHKCVVVACTLTIIHFQLMNTGATVQSGQSAHWPVGAEPLMRLQQSNVKLWKGVHVPSVEPVKFLQNQYSIFTCQCVLCELVLDSSNSKKTTQLIQEKGNTGRRTNERATESHISCDLGRGNAANSIAHVAETPR